MQNDERLEKAMEAARRSTEELRRRLRAGYTDAEVKQAERLRRLFAIAAAGRPCLRTAMEHSENFRDARRILSGEVSEMWVIREWVMARERNPSLWWVL